MNIFFGVDNEMKIALVTGADDFFSRINDSLKEKGLIDNY
tara:strand:- start:113 stop:232 length:120 start_codon:yes stop_codon:yes gene_type:complete